MKSSLQTVGSTQVVTFDHIAVPHACSTRVGGVSTAHLDSLNAGFTVGDKPENVWENRSRFARHLGVDNLTWLLSMTHGVDVVTVDKPYSIPPDRASRPATLYQADGCITNLRGVPLSLTVADCVPVFFHDPVVGAIGVSHAGWRGTVGGIVGRTVECMADSFGSDPKNVRVGIGPSIGPQAFEVGAEVADEFRARFPENPEVVRPHPDTEAAAAGKCFVDLWRANQLTALWAGVENENIRVSGWCTLSNPDLFYSHRRDKGQTGRLLAGIILP